MGQMQQSIKTEAEAKSICKKNETNPSGGSPSGHFGTPKDMNVSTCTTKNKQQKL